MRSPTKPPDGLIPQFEEEEEEDNFPGNQGLKVREQPGKMETVEQLLLSEFNTDIMNMKSISSEFKEWASSEFKKNKVSRAEYDNFLELVQKLALVIVKVETRAVTISQISDTLGHPKIHDSLQDISKSVQEIKNKDRPITYADMIQLPKKATSSDPQSNNQVRKILPKEQVVLIKPSNSTGNEKQDSEKIKGTLKTNIARKDNIKIKKTVPVRGGGLLIVLDSLEDKKKLLKNKAVNNDQIKITEPQNKKPRIIVYDVPSDLTNKEVTEEIYNKNFVNSGIEKQKFEEGCKPSFKLGPKNKDSVHWVVECEPEIRKAIINKKKIFIDMTSCRVNDYHAVQRCYKCQVYGHITKHCKKEEDICGHCSITGHNIKTCPSIDKPPVCFNCKRADKPSDHKVNYLKCPSYVKALQQSIDRTNYGSA
ncbi:uncharacterized protein LOC120353125 [Nilaparvata lugens]|uniref:uncharacterized protein LOC120353125 n=1 Tax=Nilaparvata lugens TaxID=108931 RepID=UPI00193EA084|nr:uncharacterized protein LOC120353125 [Nilaparvata lugens]